MTGTMTRTAPAQTKLLICVSHPFTLWNPPADMPDRIRARWPAMRVVHLPKYDRMPEELPDTDIFVGFSLRPEQFALARKLKWIHSTAAGVGQLMYPALRESGIEVTNASGVHRIPMAEHILGTLIALARRFPDCFRYQQQAHWAQQELWNAPVRPRELRGQILLFIGFGAIGREVAKVARPLGMRVWAVTRSGRAEEGVVEQSFPAAKLHEALPQADFVVLAAPETPETREMMGAREFARMKPSAYFHECIAWRAGGRAGADFRARTTQNRRRRAGRRFRGTAAAGKPAMEARQRVHHAAHERRKRALVGASNGFADGKSRAMVCRARTAESRRSRARILDEARGSAAIAVLRVESAPQLTRYWLAPIVTGRAACSRTHSRRIAVPRVHIHFLHLALFVGQLKQIAVVVHRFHFQFVKFSVRRA